MNAKFYRYNNIILQGRIVELEKKIESKDTTIKMLITLIEGLAKKYKIPLDEERLAAVFLSEENLKW